MDELLQSVAHNIRELRATRDLSLAQLSAQSGVAKSTLSQIEAGATNPTLGTLAAVAATLGTSVDGLIASRDDNDEVTVVRLVEGKDISDDAVSARLVTTFTIPDAVAEVHHLELVADHAEVSSGHGPGAREHAIVVRGSARLGPVGSEVVLQAGDYATYRAHAPHTWATASSEGATVWLVAVFPRPA